MHALLATLRNRQAKVSTRERLGDKDRLLDRVGDPLRRARMLEVARIADARHIVL